MFLARREKLAQRLQKQNIDVAVFVPGPNLYYFTGLLLTASERLQLAVITKEGELIYIVPQVELSKVESIPSDHLFWYTDEQGPAQALVEAKKRLSASTLTIGIEYRHMRVMEMKAVETLAGTNMVDLETLINSLRMLKDQQEIELMKTAVKICEESLDAVVPRIKSGVSEREIAAHLEFEMRKRGSQGTPFGTIVASGYRGALPHGRASDKIIEQGELVVLDFGSIYEGYVADITRTVAVGKIDDELKKIYSIVKEAQQASVESIRPGITAHNVDEAARKVICDHGYGEYFTHRTGHGLGLSGHEAPYMMQNNGTILEVGMTFTVEPGIYLPGKGGVRIEDNLLVTVDGVENLMNYTKELLVL